MEAGGRGRKEDGGEGGGGRPAQPARESTIELSVALTSRAGRPRAREQDGRRGREGRGRRKHTTHSAQHLY